MIVDIGYLNRQIISVLNDKMIPLGLLHGKMGLCVYFYKMGQIDNNEEYGKIAEHLLDEVFSQIGSIKTIDINNGLSGIGLAISYLIRNKYVQGCENTVLRDIDDEIFKQISVHTSDIDVSVHIQILYYICNRMQFLQKEQKLILSELAIHIINSLHEKIDQVLDDKAIVFHINSNLTLFLFVLGIVYKTGIYNSKIERIAAEIIPFILSRYGYLNSKKLHFLWGISCLNRYIKDERLTAFSHLLISQIDLQDMLGEFRNKNIFTENGLAGICLLVLTLADEIKQHLKADVFFASAIKRMQNSLIWELSANNRVFTDNIGLFGYCGAVLILNALSDTISEIKKE